MWSCSSNTGTRSDVLNPSSSYPTITVIVNVAFNAPSQVINQASVSGGGSAMANATDPTAVGPPPPSITPGGIVPVFATAGIIEAREWVSIYGNNLITGSIPENWSGDYPTKLGGTSVTINNKPAYLSYAAPTLIDLQAPDDVARGPVNVTVTNANGSTSATVTLADQSPSFSLLGDAKHVAGIIARPDGSGSNGTGANSYDILEPTGTSLGYKTVAAKAGDTVVLFGVGFGPTNPTVPAGQPYSGAPAQAIDSITVTVNSILVSPFFTGAGSPGLFQST